MSGKSYGFSLIWIPESTASSADWKSKGLFCASSLVSKIGEKMNLSKDLSTEATFSFRESTTPCLFYHPHHQVAALRHGDDLVFVGCRGKMSGVVKVAEDKFDIKRRWIGPRKGRSE